MNRRTPAARVVMLMLGAATHRTPTSPTLSPGKEAARAQWLTQERQNQTLAPVQ